MLLTLTLYIENIRENAVQYVTGGTSRFFGSDVDFFASSYSTLTVTSKKYGANEKRKDKMDRGGEWKGNEEIILPERLSVQ